MSRAAKIAAAAALVGWLTAGGTPAAAQSRLLPGAPAPPAAQNDSASAAAPEGSSPPPPPASEVIPRSLELADAAAAAQREIGRLADVASLAREVDRLAERLAALEPRAQPGAGGSAEGEGLGGAEEAALVLDARAAALLDEVSGRLRSLEELRDEWRGRRDFWVAWQEDLRRRDLALLDRDVSGALATVEQMIRHSEDAFAEVLRLQRRLEGLARRLADWLPRGAAPAGLPGAEVPWRDAPVLGSAEYRRRLASDLGAQTLAGLRTVTWPDRAFRKSSGWVVLLQILTALAVGWWVRRSGFPAAVSGAGVETLRHPWLTGVFVAVATLSFLYDVPPPPWTLLLWVLLAVSLAALAPQLLEGRRTRRVLRTFAVLQPLLVAAEVVRLPSPLLRLAVAAGAVVAVTVLLAGWRRSGEPPETPLMTGARRLGAGLGAAILLLEVAGFDALARWLLGSAAATVLWAFAFVFLLRLGRWALLAAVTGRAAERFPALRWVGHHLTGRLLWLVRGALLLVGVGYLVSVWGVAVTPRQGLSEILSWELPLGFHTVRLGSVLLALVTLYLGFVLSAVTRAGVDRWSSERGGVDPGVGDSIKRLLHYVVITLGFFFALGVLGFELQNLTIVLGALGVGVGFGLQNIANNFFSGLILLFERPVRVGDMVVLDGIWGNIRKIGLRSTVVQTFDQSELIVPNSDLVSEKVTNWTLSDKVTRLLIPVGVAYGSDVPKVLRLLGEVAAADPRVLAEPAVQTFFVGFGDSSLDFELRVWVGDPSDRLPTRGDLLAAIDRRFREEGLEIPFPQRDLHLRSVAEGAGERLGGGERPRRV